MEDDAGLIARASTSSPNPIRVVLADDESLFRASLRQLLSVPPAIIRDVYGVDVGAGFEVVGEAATGEDAVRVIDVVSPDLLVIDLSMPRMTGLEALRELSTRRSPPRTVLLTAALDRRQLVSAVQLGTGGVILKDDGTEVLFEALVSVVSGRYWFGPTLMTHLIEAVRPLLQGTTQPPGTSFAHHFTRRERQVLGLVVSGCSNREIAHQCSVSEQTIKHHLTRMFDKVGAANRLELAMVATRYGVVAPSC